MHAIQHAVQKVFQSQAAYASLAVTRFHKLKKAKSGEQKALLEAILAAMQQDWESLPQAVRASLEAALLSGVGQGILQIDVDVAATIADANTVAQDYAVDRAAEMVGMKYDDEGNLVPNPNAKWAISDTTREKIREIIAESFAQNTPIQAIKNAIQGALQAESTDNGIFSEARAMLIARTEIANAQVRGNFSVWEESGVVLSVKWLTAEDEKVCPECDGNDGVVVEIGSPFPNGDLYPGAHPRCRCVLVVAETA